MTRKGIRTLIDPAVARWARLRMILGGLGVIAACIAIRYGWGTRSSRAQAPVETPSGLATAADRLPEPARTGSTASDAAARADAAAATATFPAAAAMGKTVPTIVATVNGTTITREDLANDCRVHFGKEVLEAMVNKYLILQACRKQGITVSRQEVDQEIEQMAKSFNVPVEQWLKLLQQERGIRPEHYANDIIWPTLALRKLAGDRLVVSQDELVQAFETEYGEAIEIRLIVCSTLEKAKKVQSTAAARPADFGNLAKQYSEDAASASLKGLVQPVRKHSACREIEQAAFAMADGEVSSVIASAGQYAILKRERRIEPRKVTLEEVAPRLEKIIRDRKMRSVATDVFKELQRSAIVKLDARIAHAAAMGVVNEKVLSHEMPPGVVALINESQITQRQLDEECMNRHGQEVLEGMINRKLIDLACRRQNITVTSQESEAEIAHAAASVLPLLADGTPDVRKWLDVVAKKQGISAEVYRRDAVWPAVALRKLASEKIEINEDDLRKGFQANYGPRVRCRAIVMNNQRRAQQVWEMARKDLSLETFSELASKYSIEGSSRALGGEVPPIRKFGGQPVLEEEAFSLKPHEISGVIQVDDRFVILYCEGLTKPVEVEFAKVRDLIYDDIRQKKEQVAMAGCFERLQESATIDNFLAGTSRSPSKSADDHRAERAEPAAYYAPAQPQNGR